MPLSRAGPSSVLTLYLSPLCLPLACLASSQAQAYTAGYSSSLVIPQSKVDLTSPVNEFAYKVRA